MIQLSKLKTSYQNFKKDISDVSDSLFFDWCNYTMSFLYDKLLNVSPDKFSKELTITIPAGQTAYILPSDFKNISKTGTGLFLTDVSGTGLALPYTGFGSSMFGYYLTNNQLKLTQPPKSATTYILRYIPELYQFIALTDYFTSDGSSTGIPYMADSDIEYLIRAIDVQYEMWDEDVLLEATADQRFARIIDEMLSRQRQTPNIYNFRSNFNSY